MVAQYKWEKEGAPTLYGFGGITNKNIILDLGRASTLAAVVRVPVQMPSTEEKQRAEAPLPPSSPTQDRPLSTPRGTIKRSMDGMDSPPHNPPKRRATSIDSAKNGEGCGEQPRPESDAEVYQKIRVPLDMEKLRQAGTDKQKVNLWRDGAFLQLQMLCNWHLNRQRTINLLHQRQKDRLEIERLQEENLALKNAVLKHENGDLKRFLCQFQRTFKDKDKLQKIIGDILNS